MTTYQNTDLIEREANQLKEAAQSLGYEGKLLDVLFDPETALKSPEERVRLHKALARELQKTPATATHDKEKGEKSIETNKKSLEFEENTFTIDSTGWKEENRNIYNGGKMKVTVNATNDVIEYLDGDQKGEQLFITYEAFIREVCKAKNCSQQEAEQKYLMTLDEYKQKMQDIDAAGTYKDFYSKEVKDHLCRF